MIRALSLPFCLDNTGSVKMVCISYDDAVRFRKVLEKVSGIFSVMQTENCDLLALEDESSLSALIRILPKGDNTTVLTNAYLHKAD